MRIVMLGTGAALPDPDRCHTSILITLDSGRHLMLDCGHGATRQLMRVDVNPADVGDLFLTHLHHDHVCELPFFVISGWILNRVGALNIYGPDGTKKLVSHLFENGAFDADIRARGAYPARQANMEAIRPNVTEYGPGVIFDDGEVRVTAALMDHIPAEISPCYGFRIEAEGKVVVFSGDTAPCDNILTLSRGADLLIHECTFTEAFIEHRRQVEGRHLLAYQPAGSRPARGRSRGEAGGRDPYRPCRFAQPGAEARGGQASAGRPDGAASDRRVRIAKSAACTGARCRSLMT